MLYPCAQGWAQLTALIRSEFAALGERKKLTFFFNCKLIKLAQRRALLHSKHSLALYSVIKCTQRARCGISLHRCRNWIAACSPVTSADHLPHIFLCFFTLLVSLVAVHSSSFSLAPGERGGAWPTAVFLGRRQLQVPTYWGGATAGIKMQLPEQPFLWVPSWGPA